MGVRKVVRVNMLLKSLVSGQYSKACKFVHYIIHKIRNMIYVDSRRIMCILSHANIFLLLSHSLVILGSHFRRKIYVQWLLSKKIFSRSWSVVYLFGGSFSFVTYEKRCQEKEKYFTLYSKLTFKVKYTSTIYGKILW